MSNAVGYALMMKLGTDVSNMERSTVSLQTVKNTLIQSSKSYLYTLKIDDGNKKDWFIKSVDEQGNITIISPNASDIPITFTSKNEALEFQTLHDLFYYDTATISVFTMMEYVSTSDKSINEMADLLGPPCYNKWQQVGERNPTPNEIKSAIENRILSG